MSPDQIGRLTVKFGGDSLKHRLCMIAPAAFDLAQLTAMNGDGVRELGLGQAAMPSPFPDVVLWGDWLVGHVLRLQ